MHSRVREASYCLEALPAWRPRRPPDRRSCTYPAFSPGGGKIVFSSNRDGDYDLYIINADRTGDPRPLTGNSARDVLPDWQPVQ